MDGNFWNASLPQLARVGARRFLQVEFRLQKRDRISSQLADAGAAPYQITGTSICKLQLLGWELEFASKTTLNIMKKKKGKR